MSVIIERHLQLETVEVECFTGVDGQGAPSYAEAFDITARAVRQVKEVVGDDGSRMRTSLTLWIPPDADVLPDERDRVTYDSTAFIVAEVKDVKDRNAQRVHRRCRCRRV